MKHVVMVDIDALLDTRLGVLYQHKPEVADKLLAENKWIYRDIDDISLITDEVTNEEFKEWFSKRDKSIMENTRMTSLIMELHSIVTQLTYTIASDTGRIKESMIVINCYPFELDEDEMVSMQFALEHYLGNDIPIKMANVPRSKIDFVYLKQNNIFTYITHCIRDFFLGVMVDTPNERLVPFPRGTVIAPKRLPDAEILGLLNSQDKQLMANNDVFDILRLYWAPMIGVQFCPPALMSLYDPNIIKAEG